MIHEGHAGGDGLTIGIVVSRWNERVTGALLQGALGALRRAGVEVDSGRDAGPGVEVAWVPGAWEIPLAAAWMAESGRFDAIICLGAVIRGETPHFDFIAGGAMRGIADVALHTGVPIAAGILTCDTSEQALERSGLKGGNKGAEAALAAIEMARLRERIGADRNESGNADERG